MFQLLISTLLTITLPNMPDSDGNNLETTRNLARTEANQLLDEVTVLKPSPYWPAIDPQLFIQNLRTNINFPDSIHQGNFTNFCGYAVATYLYAQYDPLGYTQNMLDLYKHGQTRLKNTSTITPSAEVRLVAGSLRGKGILVKRPADQMWYLTLAASFRGFLNIFDRRFNRGDENGLWAAMERSKMDKLIKSMFVGKVHGKGKGPIISSRTHIGDDIMQELSQNGEVILYADKTFKTKGKKRHYLPAHYLNIKTMEPRAGEYFIEYWDYGAVKTISLKKRVFERAARGYVILQLDNLAYEKN